VKTDRELLELAAKAAGEDVEWHSTGSYFYRKSCIWPAEKGFFNPLHDDGECARMEVACELQVDIGDIGVISERLDGTACFEKYEDHSGDKNQTRRRASTRAAAAIGEQQNELSREA
jgi:hypothetical protein